MKLRIGEVSSQYMAASTAEAEPAQKGRYQVDFDQPLPKMDTLGGAAYACADTKDPSLSVYALVPKDGAAFRHHVLNATLGRSTPHFICPIESVPVELDAGGWVQAVILPFPAGGPLFDPDSPRQFSEGEVRNRVLPDLIAGLSSLAGKELTHRSIRPGHIYYLDKGQAHISLAECFSELPAQSQPSIYEPVDRALAHPAGRGDGDTQDDMFALGVTLLTLLTGEAPCADMSEDDVLTSRVTKGSYNTYAKDTAPRGAFGALMRGLICDDPEQRWDIDKISRWLDGSMPPEPMTGQSYVVSSHYRFQSRNFTNRRLLCQALHSNFEAATAELTQPVFQSWIRSAVKDEVGSLIVERTFDVTSARSGSDRNAQRLNGGTLSKVIQLLDHEGPLRFHSLSFMLDGLSGTVAYAMSTENAGLLRDLGDFFRRGYAREVAALAAGNTSALRRIAMDYAEVERLMSTRGLGQGMDHVLYYLNPALLCQSPFFEHSHVANLPQLLTALETLATERYDRELLIDSHIAAFCANRWSDCASLVATLAKNENRPMERVLISLKLYGLAQTHFGLGPLPNLCKHFASKLRPSAKNLHHKRTSDLLNRKIDLLAESGDLLKLHDDLNLVAVRKRDNERHSAAKARFDRLTGQLSAIERGFKPTDPVAANLGQRIAVAASFVIAIITGLVTFLPRL